MDLFRYKKKVGFLHNSWHGNAVRPVVGGLVATSGVSL